MKSLSGLTIKRLMRKHHMTIRSLALRMRITFKRVREVRESGVTGKCMCLDWYEAITGTGLFAPIVTLPDGYAGDTMQFYITPIETDGPLVKLRSADPGRIHLHRWARSDDVQAAVKMQGTH